jgi:hypothetical protein
LFLRLYFEHWLKKVIVSTRPELGDGLEDEFKKDRFEILLFRREDQKSCLVNKLTGIPLTTKLIAEIYKEQT